LAGGIVTAPAPATDQPQGLSDGQEQAVAALSTFLAEAALVGAVALPPALYAMLLRLGLSRRAVQLATRLATAPLGRRLTGSPHTARGSAHIAGTAAAQVADTEPEWRARYLLKAAGRLTRDLELGASPATAMREERRWFDQHRDAGKRRARAARAVDRVVEQSGSEWLRWQLSDKPATHTRGCLWASGRLFTRADPLVFTDDDLPPRPQFPGAPHPRCACVATPVFPQSGAAPTVRSGA
jgi:hypothetical protein